MNIIAALVSGLMIMQSMWSPALAETVSITPSDFDKNKRLVNGRASLKVIGPLHISEGEAVINNNDIAILSDSADSVAEAELVGKLIHPHAIAGQEGTISGVAFFMRGYSLPALVNSKAQESIRATDGSTYFGRIVDATSELLRIKTSDGIKIIPASVIVDIKSPRAYAFSLAPKPEVPSTSASESPTSSTTLSNLISFSPTYTSDVNTLAVLPATKTIHGQLTERHVGKRLLSIGVWTTVLAGCFAIPIAFGFATPRPK